MFVQNTADSSSSFITFYRIPYGLAGNDTNVRVLIKAFSGVNHHKRVGIRSS